MNKKGIMTIKKIIILVLLLMAVLALFSFIGVNATRYDSARSHAMKQVEPASYTREFDGTNKYMFEFQYLTSSSRCMLFFTNHQEVRVYLGSVLIYGTTKVDSPFGHTTGAMWNQIELPERSGTVTITIKPVYQGMEQKNCTFYQGNGSSFGYAMIKDSFPSMLVCFAIIIIGICLLCFWFFMGLRNRWPEEVLYLGMLVTFIGFWAIGETQGMIYMISNRVAASYLAYTCLMAVGILFIMFTHQFMHLHDKFLYYLLLTYGAVETITCEILQFLNIRDMKQTVVWTHILLVLSGIYMLYGVLVNLHRHCYRRRTIVNVIGFVVLFLSMAMDMYTYYENRANANQAGKFGILIYVLLVGIETLFELKHSIEEEQHLQFYREMAMKDMLTGCYNRNAYDEDIEHLESAKWTQVITFDLNNLKHCNDTYGHQCGDKYICDSASIIRNIYGRFGKVYRIGGDEFCVITQGLSLKRLDELQMKMMLAEREYNQGSSEVPIEIACGFAAYDDAQDKSVEDVRMRADALMYDNKKELKAKRDRTRTVL